MDFPDSREMLLLGINILVVLVVIFHSYQELSTLVNFISRTSGNPAYRITRVHRASSRVAFVFFILTAGFMVALQFLVDWPPVVLVSGGALLVGFFVNGLMYQICFINETGFGSISPRFEMEIQWNEIEHYEWKDNRLIIKLRRKIFAKREMRFHDPDAIVAVNERLRTRAENVNP